MPKQTYYNLEETKRTAIAAVAAKEFANFGYRAASISRIVAAAEIAKGSFYQYFIDKRDLYLYLLEEADQVQGRFLAAHLTPDGGDLFDRLHNLFATAAHFCASEPVWAALLYQVQSSDGPLVAAFVKAERQQLDHYLANLLNEGASQGRVEDQLHLETAVFLLRSIYTAINRERLARTDVEIKYDQLVTLLERALIPSEDHLMEIEMTKSKPKKKKKEKTEKKAKLSKKKAKLSKKKEKLNKKKSGVTKKKKEKPGKSVEPVKMGSKEKNKKEKAAPEIKEKKVIGGKKGTPVKKAELVKKERQDKKKGRQDKKKEQDKAKNNP